MAVQETNIRKERIGWEQYFVEILKSTALRSSCHSAQKGAIITKDNRIVATGYSGAPSGIKNCIDLGCCHKRNLGYGHGEGHDKCLAVHAEANAILNCALHGISTKGCTMYCTHKPCANCLKMILQSGIKVVKYLYDYEDEMTDILLQQCDLICEKVNDEA